MKTELRFEEKEMPVASLGGEACVPDLSGEMILQNRLRFPLGEEDEIYEGYGRVKNAYPYSQRNSYTRELRAGKVKPVFKSGISHRVRRTSLGALGQGAWRKPAVHQRRAAVQQSGGAERLVQRRRGVEFGNNRPYAFYHRKDVCCTYQ